MIGRSVGRAVERRGREAVSGHAALGARSCKVGEAVIRLSSDQSICVAAATKVLAEFGVALRWPEKRRGRGAWSSSKATPPTSGFSRRLLLGFALTGSPPGERTSCLSISLSNASPARARAHRTWRPRDRPPSLPRICLYFQLCIAFVSVGLRSTNSTRVPMVIFFSLVAHVGRLLCYRRRGLCCEVEPLHSRPVQNGQPHFRRFRGRGRDSATRPWPDLRSGW